MVQPAKRAVPFEPEYLRGDPLRGWFRKGAGDGGISPYGTRHDIRRGRRAHPIEATRCTQHETTRVPRKIPS